MVLGGLVCTGSRGHVRRGRRTPQEYGEGTVLLKTSRRLFVKSFIDKTLRTVGDFSIHLRGREHRGQ